MDKKSIYLYYYSMINAGILAGIPRQQATDLVIDTFINLLQISEMPL